MKKFRTTFSLLSAWLVLFLAAGCGDNAADLDLFGNREKLQNLEEVKLTICVPGWRDDSESEDVKLVFDEVERRTRGSLKLKLEMRFLPYLTYEDDLKRIIATGEEPCDLYLSFFDGTRNVLKTMHDAGLALDLTALLPEYAPRYAGVLTPEDLAPVTVDGRILAVRNNSPVANQACVLVREELLQKYNTPSIQSLEELEAFMAVLKKNEPEMTVLTSTLSLMWIFAPAYGYAVVNYDLGLVYRWDDPAMRVIPWEQAPEYPKALERAFNWSRLGYLNAIPIYTPDPILIRSKKWGVWIMNRGASAYFNQVLYESRDPGRFAEFPLFPKAVCQRYTYPPTGLVINPRSKHPERALMFIEWVHGNQANYDLLRYGIQGRHYLLKEQQYDFPEGVTRNDSYMNQSGFWGVLADIRFERTHVSCARDFQSRLRKTLTEEARFPPHGAAVLDFQGIDTVMRQRTAYDMEWALLTGGFTADTIKKFIAEEKERGIDKLAAHVQAQLDALRKKRDADR